MSLDDRLRVVAQDIEGLIVLDNCEHVLEAAARVVAELLAVASMEVAVLATSRAPLSLLGEVVHRLGTLPDAAAVALLEARARIGGAALGRDTTRALELCHRLDNLPLALELAAARLRHMPIDDVLAGLTDRFALLDDALRGLPDRHASLWTMVDWSRELLVSADRDLLQRLAVIPAPFTAEAAAMVAGAPQVRRGLAALVEQSLLSLEEGDDGQPRYRMLETVREYGDVRLDAAGERGAAMAGLVGWARAQAVELAARYTGPGQLAAFTRCAAEQDNLVAALRWSITQLEEPAAVDIAVALFHLWTVRGLHQEVVGWAHALVYVDDPVTRRGLAMLHGAATGRSLPNADRLVWTYLLFGLNGGVGGSTRLLALGRRALRGLLAQRAGEVSSREAALASALPVFTALDPAAGLDIATPLIAHPDPYVRGYGLLLRAAMRENSGLGPGSANDAEEGYRCFEAIGDHWGMGLAAQSIGEWYGARADKRTGEWLRRGERHMELVGAVQDAASIRVLMDVQRAFAGDEDAVLRLREVSVAGGNEMDAVQAQFGLAQFCWQRGEFDEALAYGEAVAGIVTGSAIPVPQVRIGFRVAVAILYLCVAESRPVDESAGRGEARAATLLSVARDEALSSHDMPVLGSWALGGAALAAHRGDVALARELWTLGVRLGANVVSLFQQGYGARLTAALGDEEGREPLLAFWREPPMASVIDRIRELMDPLLG
jgi:predicted ATPase